MFNFNIETFQDDKVSNGKIGMKVIMVDVRRSFCYDKVDSKIRFDGSIVESILVFAIPNDRDAIGDGSKNEIFALM